VARAFRDVLADLTSTQKTLVVIDQSVAIPESAKRQVALVEWPLPTIEELVVILDEFVASLPDACPVRLNGDREEVAKALQGLTHFQASSVLATAAIANGVLDHTAVDFIVDEKARLIKESGLVEFYQPDENLEIGGLDLLQTYFAKRRRAFSDEAQQFGLDTPKGALLVGVPGCGKSLAAKVLSKLWSMPLIRLDVGALMGSLVGQSEANLRQALAIAEGAAPSVLWIDEIEKGLSGVASSGHTDGGTTSRVFGQLLTWMQEKTAPVYIIATSNDISGLPPELLRAGRFDKIFFVDIPNPAERAEIWSIHLERRGRQPADFDLSDLVDASDGYTGSEIEQAVMDALVQAFDQDRELATEDLAQAIGDLMPLTQTMGERIADLRSWAERRASRASTPVATESASPTASRARGIDF
jgi:AAA+ superfamily predicted ATPase